MKTILVIEDNDEIRENTAELLMLHRYRVLTAANGKAGFVLAKSSTPDLILCDMMMPETDGLYFIKQAKSDASLQHTPIVFFSAGTASLVVQKKLITEGNAFLQKPFLEEDLLSTVEQTLAAGQAKTT
ncbi:response regulator [Flavisolibacter ginsenosidimutans]|nr:response regulator [Flavisolibacter ginsenosidimutans]